MKCTIWLKKNLLKNTIWEKIFDLKPNLSKYFWHRTIWQKQICQKDNLATYIWWKVKFNKYLWQKVQFDEIFLYNFKYSIKLSLVRNISSNCTFRHIFLPNCTFPQNFFRQIVLFVKFISPNCTFCHICKASNLNSSYCPTYNCLSSKSPEFF